MILCIDTAYKHLSLALIENNKIISAIDKFCFKNQSEFLFIELENLFNQAKIDIKDITKLCISSGPGSYTGIRISMTLAKVLCSLNKNIELYTISTLKLYANGLDDVIVILDARANRAYVGEYSFNYNKESIERLEDIKLNKKNIVGDLSLFLKDDVYFKISECFLNNQTNFEKVEDVDHLIPRYFKNVY